ncbi:MAG: hypothetical protein PWQ57_283 [Desulfovibrionales bacterium]|nr:hypothetical protein [Desulfovibrionales bacterium]
MRDYSAKAHAFLADAAKQDFLADEKTQFAVFHCIEVIGEAAARLPQSFQNQHPDIPWRKVIGMRNILIHNYFGINAEMVWETVQKDLPQLINFLNLIEKKMRDSDG